MRILHKVSHWYGYSVIERGLGYFNPGSIIPAAESEGLTVAEYLETHNVSGVGRRRDRVIDHIVTSMNIIPASVLEIGAGTGMFMEKIIARYQPERYEVYETAIGWKEYLIKQYSGSLRLICHNADGKTLRQTPSDAIDLTCAHGVFVYIPLVDTITYLQECIRVTRKGGVIIFDCFIDRYFDLNTIAEWQKDIHTFPVVISASLLENFFEKYGLEVLTAFNIPYHSSACTYYMLKKR